MPLRDLLDLRLRQSGEIHSLGRDNSLKLLGTMGFEILHQEPGRTAFPRPMSDQDDRFGVYKVLGDLLVVRVFLGDAITLVMSFLAMDQMMMEAEGIIRFHSDFALRPAVAQIVINVSNMMVDDHDHSPDLGCLGEDPMGVSFFQKPAQSGYLLNGEIMSAGPLEKTFLRAHRE